MVLTAVNAAQAGSAAEVPIAEELPLGLQEGQLAEIVTKSGTDPEHLMKDAVFRLLEEANARRSP